MSRVVLLDAGPLGQVTNTRSTPDNEAINRWLEDLLEGGAYVAIPEISDYEVRRELLRAGKTKGLARLDALKATVMYAPITTEVMLLAAALWAEARRRGRPTASSAALDADVILAAQARVVAAGDTGVEVVIATTNVGHLTQFVDARNWQDI